jgi:hypothetical protein
METYQVPERSSKDSMGKRRQMLQAELLKLAAKVEEKPKTDVKEHWKTTNFCDYAHEDIFPPTRKLGDSKPESVFPN